jgi:DNA ligase D-like protein (predicted 3'-phosphoesterase)
MIVSEPVSLKEYRKKRRFARTSEPAESRAKKAGSDLVYAIQKHQASRLHYDLRLEAGGVLRSWAIPKVPANKQGVKRLAVQTEDHPLGYEDFEGTIPEPEYGAGTVEIWDRGTYRPLETVADKIVLEISGHRLRGRFALIRIKAAKGGDKNWLFFKLKDEAAEPRLKER